MQETSKTSERVNGPTPNGGSYAIVRYMDADGTPVEKTEAMQAEVVEYSEEDQPIAMTTLDLTGMDDDGEDLGDDVEEN